MSRAYKPLLWSFLASWLALASSAQAADPELNLVPWPQSLSLAGGEMELSASSRIVYSDAALSDLAVVLAEEIEEATLLQLVTAQAAPVAGDILLSYTVDPVIEGEEHKVTVAAHATVEGETYQAVALGSVTLLQAISEDEGDFSLPMMTVVDEPDAGYRGLMVDLARKDHEVTTLKEIIEMCRLYKVRYLQLHLTDDQGCTFPLQSYPLVASWGSRLTYTLPELQDLVAFADARGVTLIPEIESPGHANCFTKSMPEFFGTSANTSVINISDQAVWDAMGTVLNEVCDVFQSAPYFHISGDEVSFAGLGNDPDWQAAVADRGVGNYGGLYNAYLSHIVQVVENRGKKAIIWDGFDSSRTGNAELDKRAIVMMYNQIERSQDYIDDGHQILNACWVPLYQVGDGYGSPPERIYEFEKFRFGDFDNHFPRGDLFRYIEIDPTPDMLGAQYCSWELPGEREMPLLRFRLPPYADRIWNPANENGYEHFAVRYRETDKLLQKMVAEHRVPEAPQGFGASNGMYPDKVRVGWEDGGNYPIKFEVYRNSVNNFASAQLIAGDLPRDVSSYDDESVSAGVIYYYWVRAWNQWGWSAPTASASGTTAASSNQALVYEPFEYSTGTSVAGKDGGIGFDAAWQHTGVNGTVNLVGESLVYPGLTSRGGALEMDLASESNPSAAVQRQLEGFVGHDLSEVWVSFLVKPVELRNGSFFFVLNGQSKGVSIMKQWVNGFGMDGNGRSRLVEGETALIVARYDCRPGLDRAYCWFNPSLDEEPSIEDADSFTLPGRTDQGDLGLGNMLSLSVARSGVGRYIFDELRIGDSWNDAIGVGVGGDPDDHDPPTPNPTGWNLVPQTEGASAIRMVAATATDANGVQYYFEETSGNPGGSDSAWQQSSTYIDGGLDPVTTYSYRVRVRDLSAGLNETNWSSELSAATGEMPSFLYFEAFDYPTDSLVSASSAWTATSEGSQGTVVGASIDYTDSGGNPLGTGGGAAMLSPTSIWDGIRTNLTNPITRNVGQELWVCYTRELNGADRAGLQLHLYNGGTQVLWFGKYGYQFYSTLNAEATPGGRVDFGASGDIPVGQGQLLVLKIDYTNAGQNVYMWADPSMDAEPDIAAADASVSDIDGDASSISAIEIRSIDASGGSASIDELRMGETWQEILGLSSGGDAYQTWSESKSLDATNSGIAQNPDFDRLVNLIEFITDSNPLSSIGDNLPVALIGPSGGTFEFKRRDDAEGPGMMIEVDYSEDLVNWTQISVVGDTYLVNENGADADDMSVPIPQALSGRQFVRLVGSQL